MTLRHPSLVLVGALVAGCADPAPPGSLATPPSALASGVASAPSSVATSPSAPSASASSATQAAGDAPPDHWSTSQRDPDTAKVLQEAREGMEPFAAFSMESDDGGEGELYLERAGADLRGRWDDTVVRGRLDGEVITLDDVGTSAVVFRGKLVGASLTGTLRGEGEERAARSLPRAPIETLSAKLNPTMDGRGLEIVLEGGKVKSAKAVVYGRDKPKKTTAEIDPRGIVVTDDRGSFPLFATARGFVGRPRGGGILSSSIEPPSRKSLPFEHGDVKLTSRHMKKGRRGTSCDIDVELVSIAGTPRDAPLAKQLEQLAVDAGAGFWPSGEAPPTLASFQCNVDAMNDTIIQSATFEAAPLPHGFIDLGWSGYSRMSAMTPPATSEGCRVLDAKKGELVDLATTLPDAAVKVLVKHADRGFARMLRSRQLTRDDFFVADHLESLDGAGVCATADGVRVLVPTGVITKRLPGPPYRFDVPRAAITPALPEAHVLRDIWAD